MKDEKDYPKEKAIPVDEGETFAKLWAPPGEPGEVVEDLVKLGKPGMFRIRILRGERQCDPFYDG